MCECELCAAVPGSDVSSPWEACGLDAVEGASPKRLVHVTRSALFSVLC